MKIETKETQWQPIVVTIETREEALLLYDAIDNHTLDEDIHKLKKTLLSRGSEP